MILCAGCKPCIAIRSFDWHLVHLPRVMVAVTGLGESFIILLCILIASAIVFCRVPLPEEASIRVAFIEACFLHEETLTLRAQRTAAIPVILFSVALLQLGGAHDGFMRATSIVLPGVALGEFLGLRPWSVFVVIVQVAYLMAACQEPKVTRDLIIRICLVPEPHCVGLRFVLLVDKSIVPHVLTELFAGGINLIKTLTLGYCRICSYCWCHVERSKDCNDD
mmetsp:Transcript_56081/g.105658  ORF Transcript_56081/g.105658 Transcript_56081/m.105658 type:complete len:222 (+) Transcript_56081:542-1207(+)